MEETNQEKGTKLGGFLNKWGFLGAIVFAIAGVLFTLAPIFTVELKWYVGEEEMKDWIPVNLIDAFKGDYANKVWSWAVITLLALVVLGIALALVGKFLKGKVSDGLKVGGTFAFILALCMLFITKEGFNSTMQREIENYNGIEANWGFAASLASLAFATVASISTTDSAKNTTTQSIAEDGMLVALAFVLNFIKLFAMPTGGSVNFQMLPLFIIALRRGPARGLIAGGLVYGLLTCITDGYGLYTFPFDYFIGFGSVAVIGFFRTLILNEKNGYNVKGEVFIAVACILATLVRFVGGCTSSMVLYGYNFKAAALYNVGYVGISGAISMVALMALYGPLLKVNKLFPTK